MNYPFINSYFSIQQGILILFVFVVACVLSTSAQYDNEHSDYIAEPIIMDDPSIVNYRLIRFSRAAEPAGSRFSKWLFG
jgi:hypothetical protein